MNIFSLFSGIGAFEKALTRMNIPFDLIGFSEIDKYAVKSYCAIHNVDESKNLGDITKIDETALPKNIDLITYGFPCQDISLAGKQKGLFNEDGTQTRSGLFFEALRIIEATKPRVAIAENVKNLTSKKFAEQFKIVLESLEEAGYNNYFKVLNAKDYGIPQNRERVFIVSIRKDIDNGTFEFPEGFPLELRLKDMLEEVVDEKFYLSDKAVAGFNRHAERHADKGNGFGWNPTDGNVVANTLLASANCRPSDNFIKEPEMKQVGQIYGTEKESNSQVGRIYDAEGISPTMDSCSGGNRMPKVLIREATKKGYAEAVEGDSINLEQPNSKTRRGRVGHGVAQTLTTSPQQGVVVDDKEDAVKNVNFLVGGMQKNQAVKTDGISTCLTSSMGTGGGYVPMHNYTSDLRIRKLTPKECWRLMGFDDEDFEKAEAVNSNTQLYKQAGNSIVVPVVEHIIKALFDCGALENKREEEKTMELKVNEVTLPEAISFNYEELKAELTAQISKYETMVYTEDQVKEAKSDRASLNKLKKALNDERIRREREYMQPFNAFKAQINEIIGIIDKPVALIDGQVKEFEEKQKKDKAEMIALIFDSTAHPEWLKIEQIFNPKWLNASVNQRTITEEIDTAIENINNNLAALQILPEFSFEAIEVYKSTLDINKALEEGKRLAEIQKRKAEAEAARIAAEMKAAETMVQQAEPMNTPEVATPEPEKAWVSFKALLSADDAKALKMFFYSRGIKYEAI